MSFFRDDARLPVEASVDAALMRRLAEGDRSAMGILLARHHTRVWQLGRRLGRSPADADDLAQEVFLRVWRAAPRFQPTAAFTTWLYRIAINLVFDARRRTRPTASIQQISESSLAAPAEADPTEAQELARQVQQAVMALPERQRVVLVLHRYQELSYQQIAESTGWSVSAVESLLVRAYAALRTTLRRLDEGPGPQGVARKRV
jgi:RNA polymerase sigma-70 factor (ECF subfamily)